MAPSQPQPTFETPVALNRDLFMRRLIASVSHLNEAILGSDVAGAYIMNVGLSMGAAIEAEYKQFWAIDRPFTVDEYAHVIVDLKQKIEGNFSLVSSDAEKVVVRTTSCPFDALVRESPSLCFMTSSVFGGIAARNFGYAKTVLHQRIALGDPGCYVTVYLQCTPEAEAAVGREYFPEVDQASPHIADQLRLMDNVHQLHRQLGETRSRWDEVVQGAAEAICVLTPESLFSFANAQWRNLLGVEGAELIGYQMVRLVHPDDQARVHIILAEVLAGRRQPGEMWRMLHRDGNWRDVLVSMGPVRDEHGQVLGVLGIFHDVTTQQETQRLKDELLSTASHELRTPVTTIKTMVGALLRAIEKQGSLDPAQLGQRLRTIEREANRLSFLGVDLLNAARLQSGRLNLRCLPHDLRDLATTNVASQREALQEKGLPHTLLLLLPPDPVSVMVERERLDQVINNLLGNAIKYSPAGGQITVQVTHDQQWARLEVSDQGIGIPAADIGRIFTPFFRAANASSRNFMGIGLGLYLSKGIAVAHGGDLSVQSQIDQGTTFTLSLPCPPEETAPL